MPASRSCGGRCSNAQPTGRVLSGLASTVGRAEGWRLESRCAHVARAACSHAQRGGEGLGLRSEGRYRAAFITGLGVGGRKVSADRRTAVRTSLRSPCAVRTSLLSPHLSEATRAHGHVVRGCFGGNIESNHHLVLPVRQLDVEQQRREGGGFARAQLALIHDVE